VIVPADVRRSVLRRPGLWGSAVVAAVRLAPAGWWRRWPPVPAPAPDYWRFRMETAYGKGVDAPSGEDVIAYLEWCRADRKRRTAQRRSR
jgi:hypothetical protein